MAAAPEVSHDEMNTHGEAPAITDYEGDDVTTEFETNERTLPPQREHDRTHETETEDDDGWIAAGRRLRRRAAASLGKPPLLLLLHPGSLEVAIASLRK